MKHILVTGSIAYDQLLSYDGSFLDAIDPQQLQTLSVSFVTPRFVRHHGGTGANIAWNLKLLNQSPLLVGTVGADGGEYLSILKERGIETRHIQTIADRATSTAILATDSGERQIVFFHPGADGHGSWQENLAAERKDIAMAVISPRDVQKMMAGVDWCAENAVPYIFDPGQQVMGFGRDEVMRAVRRSRAVICNEYEWQLLSERTGLSETSILESTPLLIVTRGEKGVYIHDQEGRLEIPACTPDQVVNPTGAGDALRAGFLAGMAAGWDLLQCGRLGAAMGSFVVEQEGTLLSHLDLEGVRARVEKNYGEKMPTF